MSVVIHPWATTVIAQRPTAALVHGLVCKEDYWALLFENADGRQRMVSWRTDSLDHREQAALAATKDGATEADVLAVIEVAA